MNEYSSIAPYYDSLMCDMDYDAWADYYQSLFSAHRLSPKSILDLACGTGSLSYILAKRGYDVVACDISPDMLSVAQDKKVTDNNPLYLNQNMSELDLYGTVDAAICSLDGINYIHPDDLNTVFEKIALFLENDGAFIFDVNTVDKFVEINNEVFISESNDVFCTWRSDYSEDDRSVLITMDIFARDGQLWRRELEEHIEYIYNLTELKNTLLNAGFKSVFTYADLEIHPPLGNDHRIFFCALK